MPSLVLSTRYVVLESVPDAEGFYKKLGFRQPENDSVFRRYAENDQGEKRLCAGTNYPVEGSTVAGTDRSRKKASIETSHYIISENLINAIELENFMVMDI